jgi:hypothetical protein
VAIDANHDKFFFVFNVFIIEKERDGKLEAFLS